MLVAFFVAALMPGTATWANPDCNNPKHANHRSCTGGGEDDVVYEAALTTGLFTFGPIEVTPNTEEIALLPDPQPLTFIRPSDPPGSVGLCQVGAAGAACRAWDEVFFACENFFGHEPANMGPTPVVVPEFTVPAGNTTIQKPGGVRVAFLSIPFAIDGQPYLASDGNPVAGRTLYARVSLQLIGEEFDFIGPNKQFVPTAPNTSTFPLVKAAITGKSVKGQGRRIGCVSGGTAPATEFDPSLESTLEVTATMADPP